MKDTSLILKFSFRLLKSEWRRFVLPFLSLAITALILILILLSSSSSKSYIDGQSKQLLGGDVVIESSTPLDTLDIWRQAFAIPDKESKQISFNSTAIANQITSPASVLVIDNNYPLYGSLGLQTGEYNGLQPNEILLDQMAADKFEADLGDTVSLAGFDYVVAGIIQKDPTTLVSGFQFFPKMIIGSQGFDRIGIEPELLQAEYIYVGRFENLDEYTKEDFKRIGQESPFRVTLAEDSRSSLQFALELVTKFLIIAVLVTAVLAAVNIYTSVIYLIVTLRKSLAIFLALGMRKFTLGAVLASTLFYVVLLGGFFGILIGIGLFNTLVTYVYHTYAIILQVPDLPTNIFITIGLIAIVALGAFVPVARKGGDINPKRILLGGGNNAYERTPKRSLLTITVFTLLPLVIFATLILDSFITGGVSMLLITGVYVLISIIFYFALLILYKIRRVLPFFLRSIVIYKKADGLFGVISFTSLFVALTAVGTLYLTQVSLDQYLTEDLSATLPTTYILDVQPSQKEALDDNFTDLTLFPNIGSRIVSIDDVRIQEELSEESSDLDRELLRSFNLTFREEFLPSESTVGGEPVIGKSGEVSVEESFARRAGIELGSEVTFLIQGFEVTTTVTNFRSSDSTSGLPFFYFVLSPEDISQFPGTYFGYTNYDTKKRDELSRFLATNMPNVLVIDTESITESIISIVTTLTILILIVTTPPLLIATLLILTLVISSYASRRREGARLRAIGASKRYIFWQYLIETVFLTLIASVAAYAFSVLISYGISVYFLDFENSVMFDEHLLSGLFILVILIGIVGWYLSARDTMPLRELLSYGQNN